MLIKGRVIVITGATGGMGKNISVSLSELGATVCLLGQNREKLEKLKNEIGKNGYIYPVDLISPESVKQSASQLTLDHPKIDALIYASGVLYSDEEVSQNPTFLDEQMQVNFSSLSLFTQLFLPHMVENDSDIVFINSSAGIHEKKGYIAYSKSKSELKKYTDELRTHINPRGIRVTSLYPGNTATPMQEKIKKDSHMPYIPSHLIQPSDISHLVISLLALPRSAEVTDIHLRPMIKS